MTRACIFATENRGRFRTPLHPNVKLRSIVALKRIQKLIGGGASSVSRGDLESFYRHATSFPASYLITVAAEQFCLAGNEPARIWPAFSGLYPDGNFAAANHDPGLGAKNFWNVVAEYGRASGAAMDPPTSALKAAKAAMVDPGEIRALGENAHRMRPLVGRGFQVWEPGTRAAHNGKLRREWRLGCAWGPMRRGFPPRRFPIWTPSTRAFVRWDPAK